MFHSLPVGLEFERWDARDHGIIWLVTCSNLLIGIHYCHSTVAARLQAARWWKRQPIELNWGSFVLQTGLFGVDGAVGYDWRTFVIGPHSHFITWWQDSKSVQQSKSWDVLGCVWTLAWMVQLCCKKRCRRVRSILFWLFRVEDWLDPCHWLLTVLSNPPLTTYRIVQSN